jgi:hypothetical protein
MDSKAIPNFNHLGHFLRRIQVLPEGSVEAAEVEEPPLEEATSGTGLGPPNSVPRSTEGGLSIPGRIKVGAEDIGGGTELISGFVTSCPLMIQPDTDLQ